MLHTPLHSGVRARWWIEAGLVPTARRAGERVDLHLRGNPFRLQFHWWYLVVDSEYDSYDLITAMGEIRMFELYFMLGPVGE